MLPRMLSVESSCVVTCCSCSVSETRLCTGAGSPGSAPGAGHTGAPVHVHGEHTVPSTTNWIPDRTGRHLLNTMSYKFSFSLGCL